MSTQETTAPAVEQKRLIRRFRVRGICLVPTEVEMEIEAPNARAAVMMAQRSDWKSYIGANDGDTGAAFDWDPTAEEIHPANSVSQPQPQTLPAK